MNTRIIGGLVLWVCIIIILMELGEWACGLITSEEWYESLMFWR